MKSVIRGVVLGLAVAATAVAQPATRKATNIATLVGYPGFYHGRPVLIVGKVGLEKNQLRVSDDGGSIRLIFKGNAPDGMDEVRGEFMDLGRMNRDEPKLSGIDLRATFGIDPEGTWPRQGEVLAIFATAVAPAAPPPAPSVRAIVLNPARYLDQKVTITGQFSGRNLLGDLPAAPAKSRYDFVIRSADAALWVANMRPKLKDFANKDIELGLDARIDTARWLEVRGTVQQVHGLMVLDAEAGTLKMTRAPQDTPTTTEEPVRVAMGPPPEVVFSTPTDEETDVLQTTAVRIQFSRDIDPPTIRGKVRVSYLESQTVERGEPVTPRVEFTTQYSGGNRVLELKFPKPLERFRTVIVELQEGIKGTDGQDLKPWKLTFSLGGS